MACRPLILLITSFFYACLDPNEAIINAPTNLQSTPRLRSSGMKIQGSRRLLSVEILGGAEPGKIFTCVRAIIKFIHDTIVADPYAPVVLGSASLWASSWPWIIGKRLKCEAGYDQR